MIKRFQQLIKKLTPNKGRRMGTIQINGMTFQGNSITVNNNRIIIDGKDVTSDAKEINITVQGDIENLRVDACSKLSVTGNVADLSTQSGDVDVTGDVSGNVSTMSGDVDCSNVGGNIKTMSGNIKHRK